MSTTQHTGHYNLPTFGDDPNDRPSWRGDFTDAMTKIDNQMYANATNITTATAAANNAKTAADAAKESADNAAELAQTNKNDIDDLDGYFGKLGVTSESTAQQLMNTINGKAENTDLTALQGTVSSLQGTVNGKANTSDVYTKGQADTTFTKQGGYSGTAQALNEAIQSVSGGLDSLKAAGVEPIAFIPATKVLTDVFSEAWLTGFYSPISRFVTIMLRIGDNQGNGSQVLTDIAANTRRPLLNVPFDKKYRPTVFIQSNYAPMGNSGSWSNIVVNPSKSGKDFLYYWPGAFTIKPQQILSSMMLTYFVPASD